MFGINLFSRSLGTDDLIRLSKELEQITEQIQFINKRNTLVDKIVSSKHLSAVYIIVFAFVYAKIYDSGYKYIVIAVYLFTIILFQVYLIKPFVNWIHVKRLGKLKKRHAFIINTLKDRSNFENINRIISRFTSGEEKDQDAKQILDEDIEQRISQLKNLEFDIKEKEAKFNSLNEKTKKSKKGMFKRLIDNVEDKDDEIIHSLVVKEVFEELLVQYDVYCEKCTQYTVFYIKKEEVNESRSKLVMKTCLKCSR
ncbi:hypothetical protein QEN19_002591 [Hanseniaspora menglaensis]